MILFDYGVLLAVLLLALAVFQVMLAAGAPYGEIAWGGQQGKILPKKYRVASAVSSLVFVFSALVVLSKTGFIELFPASFVNGYMWGLTIYLGIGIVMNALSRSKRERLWVPVIALMFLLSLLILA